MINDFAKMLKDIVGEIAKVVTSSLSDWDKNSYESVVNCLLLKDEIAVKEAVDHLVKEGKVLAVPPIYLASQKHSSLTVRQYCRKSLGKLDTEQNINRIVQGKEIRTAIDALIAEYGHFNQDYH